MGLIQDIKKVKPYKPEPLPPELMRKVQRQVDVDYLEHVDTTLLVQELYARGVPISRVFGLYYEIEEASNGRTMTVEDAILAGYDGLNSNPQKGF